MQTLNCALGQLVVIGGDVQRCAHFVGALVADGAQDILCTAKRTGDSLRHPITC
jgi:hypothetical protein